MCVRDVSYVLTFFENNKRFSNVIFLRLSDWIKYAVELDHLRFTFWGRLINLWCDTSLE